MQNFYALFLFLKSKYAKKEIDSCEWQYHFSYNCFRTVLFVRTFRTGTFRTSTFRCLIINNHPFVRKVSVRKVRTKNNCTKSTVRKVPVRKVRTKSTCTKSPYEK